MAANWSDLEPDLLASILKRLSFTDTVRFKAVCSSWNKASQSYISSPSYTPTPQIPWLIMLLNNNQEEDDNNNNNNSDHHHRHHHRYGFFSVEDKKVYKLDGDDVFRGFNNVHCVGSLRGLLMILDGQANPHLVNPFSQLKIELPPIKTLFRNKCVQHHCSSPAFVKVLRNLYITKAIFLLSDYDCYYSNQGLFRKSFPIVVVICGLYEEGLAFCVPGDNKWNHFGSNKRYKDIICCNATLYALTSYSYGSTVEVWDFRSNSSSPQKAFHVELFTVTNRLLREHVRGVDATPYLVESMGEILAVFHIVDLENRTLGFGIYKLDCGGKRWVRIETLSGRALFISDINGRISVSMDDFPQGRESFIYFTVKEKCLNDDDGDDDDDDDRYTYNVRVYNFKEKKMVDKSDEEVQYCSTTSPPFWIVPNLW